METNGSDLYLQGKHCLHRRDYLSALRCFKSVLENTRQIGPTTHLIDLLINIGNIHAQLGELESARPFYREVLDLQRKEPDPRAVGLTLVNLGNLSRESGNIKRAEAYYLEAEDILGKTTDEQSLAILYSNMGLLAQDQGDLDEALRFLKEAIVLHKKTGYEAGLAGTWGQTGRLYVERGENKNAETCFGYAATHFESLSDPIGETEALRELAKVYESRPDTELALHCLIRVAKTHRKYGLEVLQSDLDEIDRLKDEQKIAMQAKRSNQ